MPTLQKVADYITSNGDKFKDLYEYVENSGYKLKDNLQHINETIESLKDNNGRDIDLEQYFSTKLPKINSLYEYVNQISRFMNN